MQRQIAVNQSVVKQSPVRAAFSAFIAALCAISLLGTMGCGSNSDRLKTVRVTGVALLDGEPLPTGSILFAPVAGGPSAQAIVKPDGSFVAGTYTDSDGMVPGEYQVSVMALQEPSPESLLDANAPTPKSLIPSHYRDLQKSGLTASIKDGEENKLELNLASQKNAK